eukprot:768571-Hanusia_phi.AAC.9
MRGPVAFHCIAMRGLRSSAMSAMAGCVMVILVIMAASTSSKPMGERTELQQDMRPMPEGSHRLRSQVTLLKGARLVYDWPNLTLKS